MAIEKEIRFYFSFEAAAEIAAKLANDKADLSPCVSLGEPLPHRVLTLSFRPTPTGIGLLKDVTKTFFEQGQNVRASRVLITWVPQVLPRDDKPSVCLCFQTGTFTNVDDT
jgi:hypothetical protein